MSKWRDFGPVDRVVYSVCPDVSDVHAACLCLQPKKNANSRFIQTVVTNEVNYTM